MKLSVYLHKILCHKRTILLSALALVSFASIMSVGPSYAYLKMEGSPAANTFSAAQSVDPAIDETFSGSTKSDVAVNVGATDYSVYVRAAIVVTWKDASGNVLAVAPVLGTDYSMALDVGNENSKWTHDADGFYYYSDAVASEDSTDPLIISSTALTPAPESGYFLSVEVLAQTIQAKGTAANGDNAAKNAWNHAF